jgi:hypothetical protein
MIRSTDTRTIAARALAIAALITLNAVAAPAQAPLRKALWEIGAYGGYQWLGYSADMMEGLPGVPSCAPGYQDGSGNGISIGITGEYNTPTPFSVGIKLLFTGYKGSLYVEEHELVTAEPDTVTATFGHTLTVSQPAIGAEVFAAYEAVPGLSVLAGGRVDMLLGGTYHQKEEIISPGNIRYENGLRQRLVLDGDIPAESGLHLAAIAGVRYELPLNARGTLVLAPEVTVWQGLNELVTATGWKMRGIRAGLGLSFLNFGTRVPNPLEPGKTPNEQPGKF